jgi:hypothetical protein
MVWRGNRPGRSRFSSRVNASVVEFETPELNEPREPSSRLRTRLRSARGRSLRQLK